MQPETRFKTRIMPLIKALPNTVAFKIQQVAVRGTPDVLLCIAGVFVALELKRDAKAPITALQKLKLERIAGAGGVARVVYPENWELVYNELKLLSKRERLYGN